MKKVATYLPLHRLFKNIINCVKTGEVVYSEKKEGNTFEVFYNWHYFELIRTIFNHYSNKKIVGDISANSFYNCTQDWGQYWISPGNNYIRNTDFGMDE